MNEADGADGVIRKQCGRRRDGRGPGRPDADRDRRDWRGLDRFKYEASQRLLAGCVEAGIGKHGQPGGAGEREREQETLLLLAVFARAKRDTGLIRPDPEIVWQDGLDAWTTRKLPFQ